MLKVLVAPLDWGLGHATRCIPIINELLSQKCIVTIGADGAQEVLLREEFPSLGFVKIPGYGIKYGKNRALTVFRLIISIPKILICIKRENRWLQQFSPDEPPDLIISDNRYGLYLPGTVCVFITHQLWIRTSFGALVDRLLQRINYRAISRYTFCWVPDRPGGDALAGKLSHPEKMPRTPTRYIGWLSRFGIAAARGSGTARNNVTAARDSGTASSGVADAADASIDLLVLLSGPEPQRSLLEKVILEQAAGSGRQIVLVRGLPGGGTALKTPPEIVAYDHLASGELERLIRRSGIVLSRPGYSTVMDLMRLGKKAIFIPTPGQTEQEYLGDYLAEKRMAVCMRQKGLLLKDALEQAGALGQAGALEQASVLESTGGLAPVEEPGGEVHGERLKNEIRAVLDLVRRGQGSGQGSEQCSGQT